MTKFTDIQARELAGSRAKYPSPEKGIHSLDEGFGAIWKELTLEIAPHMQIDYRNDPRVQATLVVELAQVAGLCQRTAEDLGLVEVGEVAAQVEPPLLAPGRWSLGAQDEALLRLQNDLYEARQQVFPYVLHHKEDWPYYKALGYILGMIDQLDERVQQDRQELRGPRVRAKSGAAATQADERYQGQS